LHALPPRPLSALVRRPVSFRVSAFPTPRSSYLSLDVVYPITFYPGVTDEGSSAGLVLSAGAKQEANITLRAVPATRLRLTAVNNEAGTSFGVDAGQRVFGTFTFGLNNDVGQVAPGEYEVAGLPPGELTLVLVASKAS